MNKSSYHRPRAIAVRFPTEGMIAESFTISEQEGDQNLAPRRKGWDCADWTAGDETE